MSLLRSLKIEKAVDSANTSQIPYNIISGDLKLLLISVSRNNSLNTVAAKCASIRTPNINPKVHEYVLPSRIDVPVQRNTQMIGTTTNASLMTKCKYSGVINTNPQAMKVDPAMYLNFVIGVFVYNVGAWGKVGRFLRGFVFKILISRDLQSHRQVGRRICNPDLYL
jgi:hypothetical protein